MKKISLASVLVSLLALPGFASAQVMSLSPSVTAGSCTNFRTNLSLGANVSDPATKLAVLQLQQTLIKEGYSIADTEIGTFGQGTLRAVTSFQEKYRDDVLAPFSLTVGTGRVGAITRMKLQALYGCRGASSAAIPTSINLSVTNISLDPTGVTATFCNNGKQDLTSAPFRIRLNGINRDFEVIGAEKANSCDTESFGYATWGLTYQDGATYSAVALIDPNNLYRAGSNTAPLSPTATLTVPAVQGLHLSVRSVAPKTSGIQSTLCNLGTVDLRSFPVKVTVNGSSQTLDVPGAYLAGKCTTVTWPYSTFGLSYTPNLQYNVSVVTDPNNVYNETNELDNTAVSVGTP
ncbi:hypothetical protein KW784_01280 [Candidatus Parcubacteria bacterium]|nr:hypothetical protein [Candidatus Parcubacteria bacterium]